MSHSHKRFSNSINRLGKYYQMSNTDSIPDPSNRKATTLARQYKYFPRIYRELHSHATFMHGIRKVLLGFEFWSSLHFFKVSAWGFDIYRPNNFMTCDVFQRLPFLDFILFYLPINESIENQLMTPGPRLFDDSRPCPRVLHRLIYEQAANELAPYKTVCLDGFIDQDEEDRFFSILADAKSALKFTNEDLEELWEDCGGGVQLELRPGSIFPDTTRRAFDPFVDLNGAEMTPLTPRCECEISCYETFPHAGRYALSNGTLRMG